MQVCTSVIPRKAAHPPTYIQPCTGLGGRCPPADLHQAMLRSGRAPRDSCTPVPRVHPSPTTAINQPSCT